MRPASSSSFALHHNHRRRPLPPERYCPTMGKRSTRRCQCHGSPAVDAATVPAHRRGTLRQCNRRYEECLASNCRLCRDSDLKANVLPAPPPCVGATDASTRLAVRTQEVVLLTGVHVR